MQLKSGTKIVLVGVETISVMSRRALIDHLQKQGFYTWHFDTLGGSKWMLPVVDLHLVKHNVVHVSPVISGRGTKPFIIDAFNRFKNNFTVESVPDFRKRYPQKYPAYPGDRY